MVIFTLLSLLLAVALLVVVTRKLFLMVHPDPWETLFWLGLAERPVSSLPSRRR